jgi:membrane protease YdiL (CAAX protease family)
MLWVVFVLVSVATAVGWAFRLALAGSWWMWLGVGLPYLLLACISLVRLQRQQLLRSLLRFRPGDPSLGIVVGLLLLGGAWLFAKLMLPAGAVERAWLFRLFLLIGEPSNVFATLTLLGIVCCEEIVWRGGVQTVLRDKLGPRRGWVVAALLYSAAHLPSLFTLEDSAAGKNPLLVFAALGCGLCWGFLTERSGRLLPALFAHGVFTYLAAQSFRLFV